MRAIVQRVTRAGVRLPGGEVRSIGPGLLIYLGVGKDDDAQTARRLAEKIAHLRVFSGAGSKFDRSLLATQGAALVISQFTLYAGLQGGRRPDFADAAGAEAARPLYESFCAHLAGLGVPLRTGEFGAHMEIESVNDGPVTIGLDSAGI